MSRGFVKEDDQEEVPMVPRRAYLPEGVVNFVTPAGMNQLLEERQMLISERNIHDTENENEKRIALNYINAKLQLLDNRIADARVINPDEQPNDEIRFGAFVALKAELTRNIQRFQIVGVDEADIQQGKIPFISPFSRVLVNKKVGDKVVLKQAGKDIVFEIIEISYS
jgi:transcription elongation factor GreB